MHVAICLVILGAYTNIIFVIKMQILALIKQSPLWSSLSKIPDTVYVSQRPQVTSQDDWDILCKEEYLLESGEAPAIEEQLRHHRQWIGWRFQVDDDPLSALYYVQ